VFCAVACTESTNMAKKTLIKDFFLISFWFLFKKINITIRLSKKLPDVINSKKYCKRILLQQDEGAKGRKCKKMLLQKDIIAKGCCCK